MDKLFWMTVVFLAFVLAAAVWPFGPLTAASFVFGSVVVILATAFADCWRSCFTARSSSSKALREASWELDAIKRLRRRAIYSSPASEVEDVDDELVAVYDPEF